MNIFWILVACISAGIAIRLPRRWQRVSWLSTFISSLVIGVTLMFAPLTPLNFFGRVLALDAATRAFLVTLFGATSALALFAPLTFEHANAAPLRPSSHGAFFFLAYAPLIVTVTLDSFPLAVFAWAIGLIVLMLSARPQSEGRVGGAAQFLLLIVIASASLLLASRFFDLYPLTPENLDGVRNAVIFLALGFGLLLAVAPLHTGLGPLADELTPLGTAFLVGVAQSFGVWLLVRQMNEVAWLVPRSTLPNVLLWGGGLTAGTGALLALTERRAARVLAYLAMIPLGHLLVGLSVGTSAALAGALGALINRAWSVALLAGGMSFAQRHPARRWQLVGASALMIGGLALAGIAPSLGFAANYAIYRELLPHQSWLFAVLLGANALSVLTTLRLAGQIINAPSQDADGRGDSSILFAGTLVALGLGVALIGAGFFPPLFK